MMKWKKVMTIQGYKDDGKGENFLKMYEYQLLNLCVVPILYALPCFNKPLIACYTPHILGDLAQGSLDQAIFASKEVIFCTWKFF